MTAKACTVLTIKADQAQTRVLRLYYNDPVYAQMQTDKHMTASVVCHLLCMIDRQINLRLR